MGDAEIVQRSHTSLMIHARLRVMASPRRRPRSQRVIGRGHFAERRCERVEVFGVRPGVVHERARQEHGRLAPRSRLHQSPARRPGDARHGSGRSGSAVHGCGRPSSRSVVAFRSGDAGLASPRLADMPAVGIGVRPWLSHAWSATARARPPAAKSAMPRSVPAIVKRRRRSYVGFHPLELLGGKLAAFGDDARSLINRRRRQPDRAPEASRRPPTRGRCRR